MAVWKQLDRDVSDVCVLREHLHRVIIAVAQKSFSQPAEDAQPVRQETDPQPRIRRDQVQVFEPIPLDTAWTSRRFAIDQMESVVQ